MVAAIAGIGSWASWSDSEDSNGNSIVAGYLNLTLDPTTISIDNAYPGKTGEAIIDVTNDSTINGDLLVSDISLTDYENGCVESESNSSEGNDTTCGGSVGTPNNGAGEGELSEHVYVQFYLSTDNGVTYIPVGSEITLKALSALTTPLSVASEMAPHATYKIKVAWRVENSSTPYADNIYMTDATVADITTTLTQSTDQSGL